MDARREVALAAAYAFALYVHAPFVACGFSPRRRTWPERAVQSTNPTGRDVQCSSAGSSGPAGGTCAGQFWRAPVAPGVRPGRRRVGAVDGQHCRHEGRARRRRRSAAGDPRPVGPGRLELDRGGLPLPLRVFPAVEDVVGHVGRADYGAGHPRTYCPGPKAAYGQRPVGRTDRTSQRFWPLGELLRRLQARGRHDPYRVPVDVSGLRDDTPDCRPHAPAAACLSSRIPTDEPITEDLLSRIDRAEDLLRGVGLTQVRVRHHGLLARIEVGEGDWATCVSRREAIAEGLRTLGWQFITLDLRGYRTGGTKA